MYDTCIFSMLFEDLMKGCKQYMNSVSIGSNSLSPLEQIGHHQRPGSKQTADDSVTEAVWVCGECEGLQTGTD